MKSSTWITILLLISTVSAYAQVDWQMDRAHSAVKFEVEHIVVSQEDLEEGADYYTMGTTSGKFTNFDVEMVPGGKDFSGSTFAATIYVESIDTDNAIRDAHLKSQDFFDVEKYPTITFKSTSFKKVAENKYKMAGEFTMKGKSRSVEWEAIYNGEPGVISDAEYISFTVTGILDRYDYGLDWTKLLSQAGFRVSSNVTFTIQVNFRKLS